MRTIDFRRPTKFARELVRRLEHAHEGFCRSAASRLSAELRTGIELRVSASDQLPYVAAIDEMPSEGVVSVLQLEPHGTQVALVMELGLSASLVDRMLGAGSAARTEAPGGLTEVEVAVLQRAISSLVETLSTTWLELADVRFAVEAIESSPVTVQLVPPSEPTLTLGIELQVQDTVSTMHLLLPYRSLEPVIERVANPKRGYDLAETSSQAAVRDAMGRVEVELAAEVGSVEMTLADVRRLQPGDVVRLRRPASRGVVLRAGEIPAYVASPGRNANARAVQIRSRWSES